jgi:Domain of unknown function (DUF6285)
MSQDRPSAIELLDTVAVFLEREIVPATLGSHQFRARVAANLMRIIAREIQLEESHIREEVKALAELLGRAEPEAETVDDLRKSALLLNQEICERISAGVADEGGFRQRTRAIVRRIVENKLKIANPGYLAADRKLRSGIGK